MQMSEAAEVVNVFGTERVNELLGQGWFLLTVVASTYGDAKDRNLRPCYILGRHKKATSQLAEGGGFQQTVS